MENPLTWLNPLYLSGQRPEKGQSKTEKLLTDAAKTGTAWFTAMAMLRLLLAGQDRPQHKERKKIEKAVNSDYAVLSPDPELGDERQERALEKLSSGDKESGFKLFQPTTWAPDWLGNKEVHPYHLALIAATAVASGGLGYKWADSASDRAEEERLEKQNRRTQNQIDQELYRQYLKTRGYGDLPKEAFDWLDSVKEGWRKAGPDRALEESPGMADKFKGLIFPKHEERAKQGPVQAAKSAWYAYALLTATLAWMASKEWQDSRDPRRKKLHNVRKYMENVQSERPPSGFVNRAAFPSAAGLRRRQAQVLPPEPV